MPRLAAVVVSEGIAIDAITGRVTAFNMFSEIAVAHTPARMLRMCVATMYEASEAEYGSAHFERVRLHLGDRLVVEDAEPVRLAFNNRTHHVVHDFRLFNLPGFGAYRLVVELATTVDGPWVEVGFRLLNVIQPEPRVQLDLPLPSKASG